MNEPEVGGMRQEDYSKDWVHELLQEHCTDAEVQVQTPEFR